MFKKLILSTIASAAFILPLQSQTDYEYAITRHKGNKVVLLGPANADDAGKWKQIIDSDGVYEHGFTLLNRGNLSIYNSRGFRATDSETLEAFDAWLRQRHGLSTSAKWAALDLENKLIVTGVQTPSAKEFEQMLDQRGIKSPLWQVRNFLRENPGHLDAMTDLLTEVRRRALHVMPQDAKEDLDTEADLRTWGVLAAETDRVFNGNWLGLYIHFFRPDQEQPERFSKLMKTSFRKHITKVESAILLAPNRDELWNIWAWMARSLADYKWANFVNSFEPIVFRIDYDLMANSIPSSEACAWIVAKALEEKDWATVIKFAPIAKWFSVYSDSDGKTNDWMPEADGWSLGWETLEGYPIKSAYAPLLEALLRTGDIDGANRLFKEMLSLRNNWVPIRDANAAIAAEVAKSAGMDELAALWKKGEPFNKVPFEPKASPWFLFYVPRNDAGEVYHKQLQDINVKLLPRASADPRELTARGFKIEGGSGWWALISADGRVLAQDSAIPSLEDMQAIFDRFNIKSRLELYKKYIADHGSSPGIELDITFEIFVNLYRIAESSSGSQDENVLAESAWYFNKVLREHPNAMVYLPEIYFNAPASWLQNELLKSLSKPMLANIELLLFNKPSSEPLWHQWIFWKNIEGNERSLESMVERVKISPLSKTGAVPPITVINLYYEECKKNGSWVKVIGLLKAAWDREFSRHSNPDLGRANTTVSDIGDELGIYLIEAYLQDNKPNEANDIFNAVLGLGGKFTDISKILDLAKEKGHDRLAREWGEKVKK